MEEGIPQKVIEREKLEALNKDADFGKLVSNTRKVLSQPKLWQRLSVGSNKLANSVYNPEVNLTGFKKIILKLCDF